MTGATAPMDEEDLLNFNYPLLPQKYIELETKIKQTLRNISYNIQEPREIERYSDKYAASISHEEILRTINIELMGPELLQLYGANYSKDVDVINADVNENSSERKEENADNDSLAGGDDYSEYMQDEDELIDGAGPGDNEGKYDFF